MGEKIDLMKKDAFNFFHPLKVRWAEVDAQGVVFNPNYLVYADIAVVEYMRALGFPYPDALSEYDSDLVVVNTELNYRGSAVFDQDLDIGVTISRFGKTSLTCLLGVFSENELLCDIRLIYANINLKSKQSLPIPEPFIETVNKFEKR